MDNLQRTIDKCVAVLELKPKFLKKISDKLAENLRRFSSVASAKPIMYMLYFYVYFEQYEDVSFLYKCFVRAKSVLHTGYQLLYRFVDIFCF